MFRVNYQQCSPSCILDLFPKERVKPNYALCAVYVWVYTEEIITREGKGFINVTALSVFIWWMKYKFTAPIHSQRHLALGPIYKGDLTLCIKHSYLLWGPCDNWIIRFVWNGFGGLSPWRIGICSRSSKRARVICPGRPSVLSLAAAGESWHPPPAQFIANGPALLR